MIIGIISIFIGTLVALLSLLLLVSWQKSPDDQEDPEVWPEISILVAARNEETSIGKCLSNLVMIDYPKDKMEIIIGNDHSGDGTADIVDRFSEEYPCIKQIHISKKPGNVVGKANVLDQIAKKARGDVLLITDADTIISPAWGRAMVRVLHTSGAGMVVGVTRVHDERFIERLQNLEWLTVLGCIKRLSDLGYPATGLGNNMAVTKEAYESTGGYGNIPNSITEDFALVRRFTELGFNVKHWFTPQILAVTNPINSWKSLLNQRKRWMMGAFRLSFILVVYLIIQALYLPAIVIGLFTWPLITSSIILTKFFFQFFFQKRLMSDLGLKINFIEGVLFEVYWSIFWFVSLIYYMLPVRVEWKGRYYLM